jgi:hypothetical protein
MNGRFQAVAGAVALPALLALVLLTVGCKPFSGRLPGDPAPEPYHIQHFSGEESFPVDLDLGDATRDVYFTFVNPDLDDASGRIAVSGGAANKVPGTDGAPVASAIPTGSVSRRAPTPEAITAFNQDPFGARGRPAPSLRLFERPLGPPLFDEVGDPETFYNDELTPVAATCQAVIPDVDIGGGETRTLNIYVANNCWDGSKATTVTPAMVAALADQFLKAGAFNDIYDWVTAMLGPEWGDHPYSDLIPPDGEITILLCDISDDNSTTGGIVGYYWSKDNFVKGSNPAYLDYYSHERIMFTIDAVMYAVKDGPDWDATDFWPEEMFATLAHEFQHMIHFYQRGVLRDAMVDSDTWINEMASQVVEDLLADKMNVIGPRGVDGADGTAGAPNNTEGRLPLFNDLNDISLAAWGATDIYGSYSISYAFGAWLARNYGGARLLNRLMKCTSTGRTSIEDIVSQATGHAEYFPRLMQRWSAAQLLSDVTDAPPGYRYNTGGFSTSSVGAATYRLGSINLFNYQYAAQVGPRLYTGAVAGTSPHLSTSATLYRAATSATGPLTWTLDMPPGLIASVIAK